MNFKSLVSLHLDAWNAKDFTTSPFMSSKSLAFFRLAVAIFALLISLLAMFFSPDHSLLFPIYKYWSTLTYLNWTGVFLYFLTSSIITFKSIHPNGEANLNNSKKVTKFYIWSIYELPASITYMVVVVYWIFLSSELVKTMDKAPYNFFISFTVHGISALLMITELIINNIPLFYSQWVCPVVIAVLYLMYTQVQHVVYSPYVEGGFWIYPFLNTSKPSWPAWYLGMLLSFLLFLYLVIFLHKLRDRFFRKKKEIEIHSGRPMSATTIA